MQSITQRAETLKNQVIDWRRHLHQYPELSFQEQNTSKFVYNQLKSLQVFDIQTGVAGYGIVATIGSGDGPVIGLRADMDALPIQEHAAVDFASQHPGIMHACGHDAHTAMLLGAAHLLAEDYQAGKWEGTIKLIFQPAEEDTDEEGLTGAPHLLRSGAIDDLEAAIALHVCPWRSAGEIQVHAGPSMASIDNFTITVKGTGGHGGYPHQGTDPVWMSTHVLQSLYGIISRRVNPLDVGTVSIGEIYGGSAFNVIPDTVQIKGTIRSYTPEVRLLLMQQVEQAATLVHALGGEYDLNIVRGEPALHNDHLVTELIKESANTLYRDMPVYEEPFGMGGEDFSHITEKIPGTMFFLGCGWTEGQPCHLHSPDLKINEEAFPIGISLLVQTAYRLLENQGKSWR